MKNHYVPQFYLKNFSINEKPQIVYAYRRGSDPFEVNVKNIAAKNDLYIYTDKNTGKKNDEIEKMFSWLEGLTKPIIEKIINGSHLLDLSNKGHNVLTEFIAYLHVRNLSQRERQKNIIAEFNKIQLKTMASDKKNFIKTLKEATERIDIGNEAEVEELRQSILNFDEHYKVEYGKKNNDFFLKQALELGLKITPIIFNKEWHIIDSAGCGRFFITSDNPVTLIRPKALPGFYGVGIENGFIALPISPTKCIFLKNGNSDSTIKSATRASVDDINHHIMFFAHKFVYSNILSKNFQSEFNLTKEGQSEKVVVS
ncbi:DUF4238 domain-containing protein [Patescibacteria group bacterium]|nr:DUF4238 domain-containing protein [Patescibacteria group bacterium]